MIKSESTVECRPPTRRHWRHSSLPLTSQSFTRFLPWEIVVFTALHAMQTRSSDENSVRPSVRQTRELWQTEEKSVQIFIPRETKFSLVFLKRTVRGGYSFYLKFLVNRPRWSERDDFEPIIARSASAITSSEKSSFNTNSKLTSCFPMSLLWSSYVTPKPPKVGLKNAKRQFFA